METIEMRLQKLEASSRFYRKGFFVLLVLIVVSVTLSFRYDKIPEVLQAKRIEIIGEKGNKTVTLGTFHRHGYLSTAEDTGPAQLSEIWLGCDEERNSYISLAGERAVLKGSFNGGGSLALQNSDGNTALLLRSLDGAGQQLVYNRSGNTIMRFSETNTGSGDMYIGDNAGMQSLRFSVSPSGGNMGIFNRNGKQRVELGVNDNGSGQVNVFNSSGGPATGLNGGN